MLYSLVRLHRGQGYFAGRFSGLSWKYAFSSKATNNLTSVQTNVQTNVQTSVQKNVQTSVQIDVQIDVQTSVQTSVRVGIGNAELFRMGARNYRELDAWRLADQIRTRIVAITAAPAVARDFRFCDQIRGSAASVSVNIAEGFARRSPKDFARFLSIAKGSLSETQERFRDGVDRHYFNIEDAAELLQLMARCDRVMTRLRAYLLTCNSSKGTPG